MGRDAVAVFFMITAFLFIRKILDSDKRHIDWIKLYKGRFFRIFPLYFVMGTLVVLVAGYMTQWHLQVSFLAFIKSIFRWYSGGILATGPINNY